MKLTLLKALTNIHLWVSATLLQILPVGNFIGKYLFEDFGFVKWLTIAMGLDLLTGVAKVVKLKGWRGVTSRGLRDTITKCIQYGSFLIITHVITHFEIGGQRVTDHYDWINRLSMEFILIVEVKSVYENIVAINPKFDFITWVVAKAVAIFSDKKADELKKDQ